MKSTKNSIYKIITVDGTGTGFKVENHDYIITNYHVVAGSKKLAVEDHNKNKYIASVVMVNPEIDLAFLEVKGLQETKGNIKLNTNVNVESLQKVYINGFPFGMPFTVTEGVVSSPSQPMGSRHYLQTDAAVNPGNSGGPMLNEVGELVGVTTSKFADADNVGFGIKHKDILKEIEDFHFKDGKYRLKCNSCDNFIEEESKFCVHCGNHIDSSVFDEFEKSYITTFIEDALTEEGFDPILSRAGKEYWQFHQNSALVRIFRSGSDFLFATSPLNDLPKTNLKELFSYLTSNKVSPYSLGINDNKIYISYRIHISDIYGDTKEEIQKHFAKFAFKADDLDDFFEKNYGCEKSIESKEV